MPDSLPRPRADAARPATVVPFKPRPPVNLLGVRERIETLQWAVVASPAGLTRVAICDGGPDPEIGDFVLIYEEGREWASWGVSREAGGFCAWRAGAIGILGHFPTMRAALDAILAQPRRRRRRSTLR